MEKKSLLDNACLSRRNFLLGGGGVAITLLLPSLIGTSQAQKVPAKLTEYPKKKIANLSQLKQDIPVEFLYPFDDPLHSASFIVKLGIPAGGGVGVGPNSDIVAFNSLCSHMGGSLRTKYYRKDYKAIGPCPNHLTTFDLTRHGMVIAGHATESLPQVVLEVEGNDIYAIGMMGLIYGRYDNLHA